MSTPDTRTSDVESLVDQIVDLDVAFNEKKLSAEDYLIKLGTALTSFREKVVAEERERIEDEATQNDLIVTSSLDDVDLAEAEHRGRISMWRELQTKILPLAEKFIRKVESGQARSKETYKDMKEIRTLLSPVAPPSNSDEV